MKSVNRENCYIHLLEKMFNLVDKTIQDALLDKWREWKITEEQYLNFKKYALSVIQKVFKIPKKKAEVQFGWFWENHGLLIKN